MPNNKKRDGFIMQAGILATAGIIVRIIGLLYNSPLVAIIGDEGKGYYNAAYLAYSIVLLVSSYSIPSAISKVISQRLAVKEYRNAHRIFQCALVYVLVVGGIASLFVFFGAGYLVEMDNAIPALHVLAPTVFLSGILGVLRGYFQAHRSMLQTSVSQILEQILNAFFSVGMAYVLVKSVEEKDITTRAVYGSAGGAIGTGAGVLTALLFMAGVYALNKKTIKKRMERDTGHVDEAYGQIFKMIFVVVTPFILSTCIYNVTTYLDNTIYQKIMMNIKGLEETMVATQTGVLSKSIQISNIPIALASAVATALIPGISSDFSQGHYEGAKAKTAKSMKVTMMVSIPAAVGIGVLAKPIMLVLYNQPETIDLASALLSVLAVSVVFYAISTLSNAVLQSIGKLNSPIINAAIALALQTGVMAVMLLYLDVNYSLYYYAAAIIIYSFFMCLLNGISVRKHLKYRQEIDKTFIRPILAAAVMGGAAYGVYHGLYALFSINILALGVSVALGAAVYFILVIRLHAVTEDEMRSMPKGYLLVNIAKKTGIMKKTDTKSKKKNTKNKIKENRKLQIEQDQEQDDYWLDE